MSTSAVNVVTADAYEARARTGVLNQTLIGGALAMTNGDEQRAQATAHVGR